MTTTSTSTYRHREVKYPLLEQVLSIWVRQALSKNMILSNNIIQEKAKEFSKNLNIAENTIGFSNGCAPLSTLPELRSELQELISKYDPSDVFNCDETGLFYRMTPNQTLASEPDKTRITVLLGCNSNRTEKIKPLVIGNSQKPHCFHGINLHNLPVYYYWNNASPYLEPKKKKIIQILSNTDETPVVKSSSRAVKNKKGKGRADELPASKPKKKSRQLYDDLSQPLELTNITLKFLPPNTTSHLQPMDQNAWLDVKQETISNCWTKTGILPSINHVQKEVASDQIDIELDAEFEEIDELLETLPGPATPLLNDIEYFTKELEELPTEEFLNDKQIIEYVTEDPNEEAESDSESELEIISVKEAAEGLKTFITFFTQQPDNSVFNYEDLKIFNKYSKLMNVKLIESKKQTSIDSFFSTI
ncbi:hypothetical protein RclHR1_15510002 [Rhizophagus clarus]|uniref:Tigger transposable element-derived protein 6-like n=1 Tax=Rhizophagus clarus TaxID=94130 RepID=A0A2Z6QFJ4_9GLOM|nr:hypothetical protein RclHR1_15510002 [Rhizophagus clarus]GES78029.1 tigger transposable element-derived protein 6-like [Rhizophagus clarus]